MELAAVPNQTGTLILDAERLSIQSSSGDLQNNEEVASVVRRILQDTKCFLDASSKKNEKLKVINVSCEDAEYVITCSRSKVFVVKRIPPPPANPEAEAN
eukprot:TRINITY_DN160_c0_g2_i1.p1 TRINITY_DN160_c0_g2~~TRINITY_DN160_c0_g2_i1.p1  ORF type:complete len:100 (-),score=20.91 TRINITY_DN160_c0_g2_i1:155-454(-)